MDKKCKCVKEREDLEACVQRIMSDDAEMIAGHLKDGAMHEIREDLNLIASDFGTYQEYLTENLRNDYITYIHSVSNAYWEWTEQQKIQREIFKQKQKRYRGI